MNRYDDDTVITLLRESVPPGEPDYPDRATAVRRLARRQHARLSATLGAVAVSVIVAGAAVVAARPAETVGYAGNPRDAMVAASRALLDAKTAHLDMAIDYGPEAQSMGSSSIDVDLATGDLAGTLTPGPAVRLDGGTGPVRIRVVDEIIYLNEGSGWERYADNDDAPYAVSFGLVGTSAALAEAIIGDGETVGTERVGKVETVRYRASLDWSKMAGDDDGGDQRQYRDATIDMWIDGDGLPRRMLFGMLVTNPQWEQPEAAGGVQFTMDLRFSAIGEPVDITAPKGATDPPPKPGDESYDLCENMMPADGTCVGINDRSATARPMAPASPSS